MQCTHTPLLIKLVGKAGDIAKFYEQPLSPDHFLLGIIDLHTGVGYNVLTQLIRGDSLATLRGELERRVRGEGIVLNGKSNEMVERMYGQTRTSSEHWGNNYQGTQHILCALAKMEGTNGYELLRERGVCLDVIKGRTSDVMKHSIPSGHPSKKTIEEEELTVVEVGEKVNEFF